MAKTYTDYKTQVETLVKDDGDRLDPETDVKLTLAKAARWYSNYDRRQVVEDLTSDGSGDFAISGLTAYEDRFSEIDSIESPIAGPGIKRSFLKESEFEVVNTPDGLVLRLYKTVPAGDEIRVTHTALHLITDEALTVPDAAFDAICEYGAGACFDVLSNQATPTTERAPQASDLGGLFRELSDKYASRSKTHKATAKELLTGFMFV